MGLFLLRFAFVFPPVLSFCIIRKAEYQLKLGFYFLALFSLVYLCAWPFFCHSEGRILIEAGDGPFNGSFLICLSLRVILFCTHSEGMIPTEAWIVIFLGSFCTRLSACVIFLFIIRKAGTSLKLGLDWIGYWLISHSFIFAHYPFFSRSEGTILAEARVGSFIGACLICSSVRGVLF